MHRRDVAGRRGLYAGAHRRVAVGDQRMIEGKRSELDAVRVGELADLRHLKSGHWNSLRRLPGPLTLLDGDTVQDARRTCKAATGGECPNLKSFSAIYALGVKTNRQGVSDWARWNGRAPLPESIVT